MTIKEIKDILKKVPDNTTIEVVKQVSQGKMHCPITSLTYDKKWDTWQINIE